MEIDLFRVELTEKLRENSRTSLIKCPMMSDAEMEVRIKTLLDMNIILCVEPLGGGGVW